MSRRFTAPVLVYSVAATMVDELHAIAKSCALSRAEPWQVSSGEALADALRTTARQENHPENFAEAFAPLRDLFDQADTASREGRMAVPSKANRHPFPVTCEHLAWFGVSSITDGLLLIVRSASADRHPRRLAQLKIMVDLQVALAELAATGPAGGPAVARVQDAFVAAEDIIGGEIGAIFLELLQIATAAAPATRH